jgi:hypothetical protein
MHKQILGREPAVFFALVASLLLALIRFLSVPEAAVGALNGAVLAAAGLATAVTVASEKVLPALVGLVQAVFAVFLAYGTPVPETTQTAILGLIAAGAAFLVRGQVSAHLDNALDGRLQSAYDNGYQSGQDFLTSHTSASWAQPKAQRDERAQETGTHGHTEVMPRVGDIYDQDQDPR